MTDLTPEDLAALRALPTRHEQANALLLGHVGPLARPGAGPFTGGQAGLTYLCWLLRMRAGMPGEMLGKAKPWEADETFGNRVRSTVPCVGTLPELATELAARLGLRFDRLKADDLLWWRSYQALYADAFRALVADTSLTEVLVGVALLSGWMREVRAEAVADQAT